MKLFGLQVPALWSRKGQTLTLDQFISRLDAMMETVSGIPVTPETALEAPTVQAVVKAVASRISILPVHVYRKTLQGERAVKELLPSHPVEKLLAMPSQEGVDRVSFWSDAASWMVRYGNFFALKSQARTGPIRRLVALPPYRVTVEQLDDFTLRYRVTSHNGPMRDYAASELVHARSTSRNGYQGDSPILNARESIALEIAAERFGGAFFGNGAMPSFVFSYVAGSQGHQTEQQRTQFLESFRQAYGARNRFRAMILPKGMEVDSVPLDNEKAQFLATRQYQRTVIAGALGVPPHLVGDLQKATYNNVEQQSIDFITTVILPYVALFEAALERDLLTVEDRNSGVIIRFNLDAALRGDFKTRQEGMNIQRQAGVISANEWREREGMNPRPGGDTYYEQGPSGQTAQPSQSAPDATHSPDDPTADPSMNGKHRSFAGVY